MVGSLLPNFQYTIDGVRRNQLYFWGDGVNPSYSVFVSIVSEVQTKKERAFSLAQETIRQEMERVFGVLFLSWSLLVKLYMTMEKKFAVKVIQAAIILYNVVVEVRWDATKASFGK